MLIVFCWLADVYHTWMEFKTSEADLKEDETIR